jgi:hypothetical protein
VIALTGYVVARFNGQNPLRAPTSGMPQRQKSAAPQGRSCCAVRSSSSRDDDIEPKAALVPPTGGEVMGEAEVEFATEMPADQEVEFAARGLEVGATYTLVVDGREVASVVADPRGRIAIELEVPLPGAR